MPLGVEATIISTCLPASPTVNRSYQKFDTIFLGFAVQRMDNAGWIMRLDNCLLSGRIDCYAGRLIEGGLIASQCPGGNGVFIQLACIFKYIEGIGIIIGDV